MRCYDCPDAIVVTEAGEIIHDNGEKFCTKPYLPNVTTFASPEPYWTFMGRACIVSTSTGMVYYGVVRGLSPAAVVVVARNGAVVPVKRELIKMVSEMQNPHSQGLRHDDDVWPPQIVGAKHV